MIPKWCAVSLMILLLDGIAKAGEVYVQIQTVDSLNGVPTTMPATQPNTVDVQQSSIIAIAGSDHRFFSAVTIGTRVIRLEGTLHPMEGAFYRVDLNYIDATVFAGPAP